MDKAQEHVPGQDTGLSLVTKDHSIGDSEANEAVLVNTNQFYKWFTDLELAMKSETEEKYRHYVNTLTERILTCDDILRQVDETLDLFNQLQFQHNAVATKTKTLHDACDRLVVEKQRLIEFAEALQSKLKYFDELENVKGIVHQRISEFAKKEALPSLTRSGCAYLMQVAYTGDGDPVGEAPSATGDGDPVGEASSATGDGDLVGEASSATGDGDPSVGSPSSAAVCQLEHQLLDHFFPSSSEDISSLTPLIDPLSTYLYDTLRPKLIHETNVDLLCELVDILKVEVLGEQLSRRSESLAGLRPTLERILADVHERLTFRARTHISDEIANYIPSDEDLNYPAKLEQLAEKNSETTSAAEFRFKTWYPPLEKTLSCLSKLYQCLEPAVFTGLAQEAVEVCSVSIQKASKLITKRSTPMDGQLFLIKHLLILREQIAPFDIEFSVTHKELDFSHLLEHLRRILRGQASLFDWSRSTSLARTLSPRVLESQIDTKKELEKSLKATCEEFIMAVTKLIMDPMLSFATKVTAVKVSLYSAGQNQKVDLVMEKPLKEQAFATPDKVAELVQKVNTAIQQELPPVMVKMKLYLQNPSIRTILFKLVKTNIVEAHIQVQSLLKSEFSLEEQSLINMISKTDLNAQLDGLL
ncbi:hypothetical protein Q3G72_032182 [Acer saccharum]|nr:hypothetical protein Q3G72_032182 [Acer saccharum]